MKKKLKQEEDKTITINMPEVKDIPGQEHVRPPRMREMEDTTAASDSEEGKGILDDLNRDDEDIITDDKTNVSRTEKELLAKADRPIDKETKNVNATRLDKTDGEDALNESSNTWDMGEDLDVPGAELDDENEELGEEDEENNPYSKPEDQ
jgi:hypothetical protein